jgi:predicted transcriptional regulator
MNAPLPISSAILKRLDKLAKERGCTTERLVNTLLKERLDYEARFEKEVDKGLASLKNEPSYSTQEVFNAVAKQRAARAKRKSVA